MSKLTEVLKLFCYDPETDGNLTFNVTEALNNNWDKIDAWASGIKTTIMGLVPGTRKVNGKALSEDLTLTGEDIKVSGSDETSISSSLSNKVNAAIESVSTADSLIDYVDDNQIGFFTDWAGVTPGAFSSGLFVRGLDQNNASIIGVDDDGIPYFGGVNIKNRTVSYKTGATATPPQEHAIVPKNGATFVDGYKNSYSKDQFGRVTVYFSLRFDSIPTTDSEIFSLPESFRPLGGNNVVGAACLSYTVFYPALVTAYWDGSVRVAHNSSSHVGPINLHGFLVIDTGGT